MTPSASQTVKDLKQQMTDQGYLGMRTLDLAALILAVSKAAKDPEIGWLDANRSLEEFYFRYGFKVKIPLRFAETALYCANLLDEQGKWEHPLGWSFNHFLREMKLKNRFSKKYNWIEKDWQGEKKDDQ